MILQVRDLDSRFYEACNTTALLSLEKYGQEGSDLEALPEEARTLLQDKDTLLNAVQVLLLPSVSYLGLKQLPGVTITRGITASCSSS